MKNIVMLFIFTLLPSLTIFSDNATITAMMEKVNRFYKQHPKMEGSFILKVNDATKEGKFYYYNNKKKPAIKFVFIPSDAQPENIKKASYWLVQNNKLWIYLSGKKILIEQSIPKYFVSLGSLGGGLNHYFSEYKKFETKDITKNKKKLIQITFTQPKKNSAFSKITLEINNKGFQEATYADVDKGGKESHFEFNITDINFDPSFDVDDTFHVNPSGDVQILRNVLIQG